MPTATNLVFLLILLLPTILACSLRYSFRENQIHQRGKTQRFGERLDVDGVELYKAASGYIPSPNPAAELTAIFRSVLDMTPKERTALLASLRKKK